MQHIAKETQKKSPAKAKGSVQQRCMFENKNLQLPEGTRWPVANYL